MFNIFKKKPESQLPHWGDTKNWIEKVINSVDNPKQITACRQLIYLWCKTYSNELGFITTDEVRRHLSTMCDNKFYGLKEKELFGNGK
jgi:hypothetical protein